MDEFDCLVGELTPEPGDIRGVDVTDNGAAKDAPISGNSGPLQAVYYSQASHAVSGHKMPVFHVVLQRHGSILACNCREYGVWNTYEVQGFRGRSK